ncbi:NAD(P)-binding protein [Cubamyces lactineus]|nr:NAD(P)-binding protein [Cubamyces lactineus]
MTSGWTRYSPLNAGMALVDQRSCNTEWSIDDIPDQSGKVFLITGGNTGLGTSVGFHISTSPSDYMLLSRAEGLAAAKVLLARNARVYITSRDRERGQQALHTLRRISESIHVLDLDLADLHSVRKAALEFMRRERQLHVLINNAGIMCPPLSHLTQQRYDLQFGVNVLGHFYLTKLLLPVLLSTAKQSAEKVRVINYTCAIPPSCKIDYTTLMDGPARRKCSLVQLHRQSKLGTLLFSHELAEQYGEQGIVSIAVNPGNVHTELTRHTTGVGTAFWNLFSHDVTQGVVTPLFAATAPRAEHLNSKLLGPDARTMEIPASLLARGAGEALWDWSDAQTECFEEMANDSYEVMN